MKLRTKFINTILITLIINLLYCNSISGQSWKLRRYEIGGGPSIGQLFGDIGGVANGKNWFGLKDISLSQTRYGISGLARYKIQPVQSVKASIHGVYVIGDDANFGNSKGRSYKAYLFEFSGQYEYYLVQEEKSYRSSGMYNRRGMLNNYNHYALYGFAGLGAVYSISKVSTPEIYPNDIYNDGGKFAFDIPFGIGVKYILDSRYSLNAEFGYRYSFSDYLEGASNIYSEHKDVFYFLDLNLSYRLKTTTRNLPAFLDKHYRKYGY